MPPSTRSSCALPTGPGRNDLGAALASVPGRVGAVHRAPWRAPVDRRDRRRRRARDPGDNALAPLGRRIATTNPDYRGVFVFTNDLPVFSPDAPEPVDGDDLYRTRRAVGTAEVVCYHHDPTQSMADLDDDEVTAVVARGANAPRALQALDGVAHVLIFENRGAAVGTSNPHPHCQIYAGALVYGTTAREAEVAAEHHDADRPVAPDGRRRARARRTDGWSATVTTSSRACRGSRATPTRCTCCPVGR